MATKTRTELKAYFNTGDKPTEAQFADFIDAVPNIQDAGGANSLIRFIKKSLTAAEIKTGNSVPIDVGIPLPGASQILLVQRAIMLYTFVSAAFTSTTLLIKADTATFPQVSSYAANSILTQVISVNSGVFLGAPTAGLIQYVANKKLYLYTNADSAVGDSTVDVYVWYTLCDL